MRPNDVRDAHFADNAVLRAKNLFEDAEKRMFGGVEQPILSFVRGFSCVAAAKNSLEGEGDDQNQEEQDKRDEMLQVHRAKCRDFRAKEWRRRLIR